MLETIKNLFSKKPNAETLPSWKRESNDVPWFDRPDAHGTIDKKLARKEITEQEANHLRKWVDDGYLILDSMTPMAAVDQMVSTLDNLWMADKAIEGLELLGVRTEPEGPTLNLTHEEILKLDANTRKRMPALSNWRIHEFRARNKGAGELFANKEVTRLCSLLFGKKAVPRSSINFMYGSAQEIHQDMAVFHVYPHNFLIGAWYACEDIDPESGPLVYYPKSHRIPFFEGFTDYPQTQLRTIPYDEHKKYYGYLHDQMKNFERKEFIAKKGQLFLWHGALVHGGSAIKKPGTTRKSFVVHYLVDGVDRTDEIKGPFNWG